MHIVEVVQQDDLFPNFENSHKHKEKFFMQWLVLFFLDFLLV